MKHFRNYFVFLVSLAAALWLGFASTAVRADDKRDHDRARQAVAAGEVLPLQVILERVEKEHPGKVMEVELERESGRWIYEIKLLRGNGALVKLKFNARDGTLLSSRERDTDRNKRERSRDERR